MTVPVGQSPESIVIVGASASGLATATQLRRQGYSGRLKMIGDEDAEPYDRPPLSKQFLSGDWGSDQLSLMKPGQVDKLDLDLVLGARVVSLDLEGRHVNDEMGREHGFDALVIATGVRPRRLNALRGGEPHVLRTLADADRLRKALREGTRLVVIGGGFLGLETAATARALGAQVTVIEPALHPLANRVGMETSSRLLALHRDRDVELRTGTTVVDGQWDTSSETWTLQLSDESTIDADEVLVAIGSIPQTEWLEGTDIKLNNGVICDSHSRAALGVWAVGDVACWWDDRRESHVRLEHRTNATEQARAVAGAIMGNPEPYRPVPFFWTDHFGVRIQVAGLIPPEVSGTPVDLDSHQRDSSAILFHEGDELSAVLGWNAPREVSRYRQLLLKASRG
ncbi:FAD/NAD(P)-binding oxidoreductase [Rhodococcus sp. USK13]|uniref:NAD(P)/FAD-dependent oxidoreductase n=1 Tax=Rhodococcus sp. USK13 TaxID=2806442 RepID=UPI001BCD0F8D|nr:FAD/NAD(P)-binding oxidoreductase [Rhodococcus sp. USK13]